MLLGSRKARTYSPMPGPRSLISPCGTLWASNGPTAVSRSARTATDLYQSAFKYITNRKEREERKAERSIFAFFALFAVKYDTYERGLVLGTLENENVQGVMLDA